MKKPVATKIKKAPKKKLTGEFAKIEATFDQAAEKAVKKQKLQDLKQLMADEELMEELRKEFPMEITSVDDIRARRKQLQDEALDEEDKRK